MIALGHSYSKFHVAGSLLQLSVCTSCSEKVVHLIFVITSANVDRLLKFLH